MKILNWREAVEYYLLGLDQKYPEIEDDAMSVIYADVEQKWYSISTKIANGEFPIMEPDFIDIEGRPRLLLSTIANLLDIPQELLDNIPNKFNIKNKDLRWSLDFLLLTKDKYSNSTGLMKKIFLQAWHNVYNYSPKEFKNKLENIFCSIFPDIKPMYTDENGDNVYDAQQIANILGIEYKKIESTIKELTEIAPDSIFQFPEPKDNKIH